MAKPSIQNILRLPRVIIVGFIIIYQKTLSPDHGIAKGLYPHGYCRFYPSCSEYSKQAILKFGIIKGVYLAVKRIGRCNPYSEFGLDIVPEK